MKKACPYCRRKSLSKFGKRIIVRGSSYRRKSDGQRVARFWCKMCRKSFSSATQSPCRWQKKRHRNEIVRRALTGGVSQREAARMLNLNRKTIVRKFLFLAQKSQKEFYRRNKALPPAVEVEFDDLETFIHSKCKPVSVTLFVEYKTRRILDLEVAQMPAKGRLAAIARRKYGKRSDHRPLARKRLFQRLRSQIAPDALIRSDSNPAYPLDVRSYFPEARHELVLGGRGAITGQGELKKLRFDPIFSLNHTCAMLRAHLSRLFRKTWNTTKKLSRLRAHLMIYALEHNQRLSTN